MLVYILLAGITGILALIETGRKSKKDMKMFYICLFLFLLVSGLRYGEGDYLTYEMGYNNRIDVGGDKGYYLIQLFFERLGFSFQSFVFIITLFSVFAFFKFYKLSTWPVIGMTVILGKFFTFYAMSGIRQYIAMAICWWAISELLLHKRRLLFLGMVFIAFTIHGSALVILPVYFFRNMKFSFNKVFLILAISVVVSLSWRYFFEQLFSFSEFANERLGSHYRHSVYHGASGMNMINYVENLLFLFIALYVRKKAIKQYRFYDFFLFMFVIYCGFLIAGSEVGAIKRLRDYYGIAYAVLVPYFVYLFKGVSGKKFFRAVLIAYFVLLMFRSLFVYDAGMIPGAPNRMIPYKSVFVLM